MTPRRERLPRFGIFAEGSHYSSARGLDALVELWRTLAQQSGVAADRVDVHAFHKGQIELMSNRHELEYAGVALHAQRQGSLQISWQ